MKRKNESGQSFGSADALPAELLKHIVGGAHADNQPSVDADTAIGLTAGAAEPGHGAVPPGLPAAVTTPAEVTSSHQDGVDKKAADPQPPLERHDQQAPEQSVEAEILARMLDIHHSPQGQIPDQIDEARDYAGKLREAAKDMETPQALDQLTENAQDFRDVDDLVTKHPEWESLLGFEDPDASRQANGVFHEMINLATAPAERGHQSMQHDEPARPAEAPRDTAHGHDIQGRDNDATPPHQENAGKKAPDPAPSETPKRIVDGPHADGQAAARQHAMLLQGLATVAAGTEMIMSVESGHDAVVQAARDAHTDVSKAVDRANTAKEAMQQKFDAATHALHSAKRFDPKARR